MSDRGRGDSSRPSGARGARLPAAAADEAIPPAAESGERALVAGRKSPTPVEPSPDSLNRRSSQRVAVTWSVDCETEDTFLYASITNISEMGIFVRTIDPLPVGTQLTLRFAPPVPVGAPHTPGSRESFVLAGVVQWINRLRPHHDNPNPGMGIRFLELGPEDRERIVETIRTIAYLRDDHRSN